MNIKMGHFAKDLQNQASAWTTLSNGHSHQAGGGNGKIPDLEIRSHDFEGQLSASHETLRNSLNPSAPPFSTCQMRLIPVSRAI